MSHSRSLDIAADHPAYTGHFPGEPILPGVVLLDAAVRAAGASEILSAKFHAVVRPGEPLTLDLEPAPNGAIRFTIRSAVQPIASGVLKAHGQPAR